MSTVVLFNKPFQVLCQFRPSAGRKTLADYLKIPNIYPAGRLDYDSEGLMILTDDGQLQAQISNPKHKLPKTYWVQVEGDIDQASLQQLQQGVVLNDGKTKPAKVRKISPPDIWARVPPIRSRENIPTTWIEMQITEGRNRQVRRMTAAVGYPTLRLVRVAIGNWKLDELEPGQFTKQTVHTSKQNKSNKTSRATSTRRKRV